MTKIAKGHPSTRPRTAAMTTALQGVIEDAARREQLVAHLRAEGKSAAEARAEADEIIEDQKPLAEGKSADTNKAHQDSNQESTMAKNAKADKAKKSKPANDLPTYGMPFKRRSTPSSRWVVVDALMKLTKPITAAALAEKIGDKLPKGEDRAIAHVATTAAWMEKNGVKGFVGLLPARGAKAEKPAKASKPKAKKSKKDDLGDLG